MKGYVYVLQLSNDRRYYGSTNDLARRMKEYKSGKVQTTKNKFVGLLGYKEFETLLGAREYEKKIKSSKNKQYIADLFGITL